MIKMIPPISVETSKTGKRSR